MSGERIVWGDDPEHEVLPHAWEYEIVGLRLEREPPDGSERFLDLTVRRGTDRRVLRFWSPQDLEIERGGPSDTGGLMILDIAGRQLEGLAVQVIDCELSPGAVRFVARKVEEITGKAG